MESLKKWLSEISLAVYILVILFGIASWIDINGVWVEFPLFVNVLPEGWGLPSYLSIISQVANIGPIIYIIANYYAGQKTVQVPAIYIIIIVGAAVCLLLAFLWKLTTVVDGEEHSTALLTMVGFLSLVDCTSSVAFLPYMARFKPHYMTAYYIGEGLSGLLPGLASLIQGVGSDPTCVNTTIVTTNETTGINITSFAVFPVYDPPLFPVQDFFIFLFVMIVISGISFSLLHYLPFCQKEKLESKNFYEMDHSYENKGMEHFDDIKTIGIKSTETDVKSQPKNEDKLPAYGVKDSKKDLVQNITVEVQKQETVNGKKVARWKMVYLLILTGWACGLTNTVMPSIGSYSSLPYGNLAYTLGTRLSAVANPVACLIALFLPTRSMVALGVHTLLGSACMGYQLYLASVSPFPPLKGTDAGTALTIITQVLLMGFLSYEKVSAATVLNESGGHKALLWVGVVTQIGSCVGAIVTFIVINVYNLLQGEYPCS